LASKMFSSAKLGFAALILAGAAAVGLLFVRYFVLGTLVITYKDEVVTCGEVRRPLDVLAVHSGRENFIRVGGRTYRRVRGLQPFYLRLPRLDSILFVTSAGDSGVEFHIVRVGDWTDIKIRGEKLSFGAHVGAPDSPGSPYTDYVESASKEEIVLTTRYPRGRKLLYLNLRTRSVTRVEDEVVDESGHIVTRHAYVNGKQVQ
jgi:hypothetical protein